MDLPQITAVMRPQSRAALPVWQAGHAYLAGGTWMFSEPQPTTDTLVDLHALDWPALEVSEAGLRIGATCTIGALAAAPVIAPGTGTAHFPAHWLAARVIAPCCQALLGSFKIAAIATVGGNVCLALAASPMLALTVALDGVAVTWSVAGERTIPMVDFAIGPQQTVLGAGEVLRAIDLPVAALCRRAAMRQVSLTQHGRSAALLIATRDPAGPFALTITAATRHPLRLDWPAPPTEAALDDAIAALPPAVWYDDLHGQPAWRRHMTRRLAIELLAELA